MFGLDADHGPWGSHRIHDQPKALDDILATGFHQMDVRAEQGFAGGTVDKHGVSLGIHFYVGGKPGPASADNAGGPDFFHKKMLGLRHDCILLQKIILKRS